MKTTLHRAVQFSALVVDDNYALREAIARDLARDGGDVTTAPGGLEGLEAIRGHQFDVVITDVHMPRRGGLWLWEQALALQPDLRGKFVFMSSEPLPDPPSGAVFMVKPLSLATLQSEVRSIVRGAAGATVPARQSAMEARVSHRMSSESIDVPTLLRAHIHLQGVLLTEDELSKLWVSYLAYEATGRWQVREHARVTRVGAREYRVVRGSSIPDVYRSPERGRAAAVETALNELESQEESRRISAARALVSHV